MDLTDRKDDSSFEIEDKSSTNSANNNKTIFSKDLEKIVEKNSHMEEEECQDSVKSEQVSNLQQMEKSSNVRSQSSKSYTRNNYFSKPDRVVLDEDDISRSGSSEFEFKSTASQYYENQNSGGKLSKNIMSQNDGQIFYFEFEMK